MVFATSRIEQSKRAQNLFNLEQRLTTSRTSFFFIHSNSLTRAQNSTTRKTKEQDSDLKNNRSGHNNKGKRRIKQFIDDIVKDLNDWGVDYRKNFGKNCSSRGNKSLAS